LAIIISKNGCHQFVKIILHKNRKMCYKKAMQKMNRSYYFYGYYYGKSPHSVWREVFA